NTRHIERAARRAAEPEGVGAGADHIARDDRSGLQLKDIAAAREVDRAGAGPIMKQPTRNRAAVDDRQVRARDADTALATDPRTPSAAAGGARTAPIAAGDAPRIDDRAGAAENDAGATVTSVAAGVGL